jgi:serine/threonine-protein kinase HipA
MPSKAAPYLLVTTPQGQSGVLTHAREYLFQYDADMQPEAEIGLNMPARPEQYRNSELFPVFEMNLPEGYVLEELRNRFAKTARFDPMLLLAMTGREAAVGRVAVHAPDKFADTDERGVPLKTILAWDGAEDLFQQLSERYLTRTGISGVQPKLLVPEAIEPAAPTDTLPNQGAVGKAAYTTKDLIVKSAGDKFPGLTVNEFLCMSIAREAGMPVPEFFLSDNRKLFVIRRFDRTEDGQSLGFEDMTSLMVKPARDKYRGSYAQIAKAIELYCAPQFAAQSKAQLFDLVALSCIVGNGDAHLKNFGVLYTHPRANDVRLAPAYDLVNTTRYLPGDELALSLGAPGHGSRSLFLARTEMQAFAEVCEVADPVPRLERLLTAAETVLYMHQDLLDDEKELKLAIRRGVELFSESIAGKSKAQSP